MPGGDPVHPDTASMAAIPKKRMAAMPEGLMLSLVTPAMSGLHVKMVDPQNERKQFVLTKIEAMFTFCFLFIH
jgi:hypothetical protein